MEATEARLAVYREAAVARWQARQQLVQELSTLSAHLNAATARWLELEARRQGVAAGDDFGRYLAWRCDITTREAREYLRVAEALQELPALRAAFARGELSFCKAARPDPGRDTGLRAAAARAGGGVDGVAAGACPARVSPAAGGAGA